MADLSHPFSLAGKRVVVTGGASGVGAALVELLAELGRPDVTVLDLKSPTGPHATYVETNLADESSVDAALASITGSVDVLFNNAGVNSSAGLRPTIAVNYLALRRLSEGLASQMAPGSAVVNTASSAGNGWAKHAEPITELLRIADWEEALLWVEGHTELYQDPYVLSKEIVQLWTLRAGAAGRTSGVRTNSVCPAPIDTPLLADFRKTMTDKLIDWNIAEAAGRVMSAREVAMPLAFLGS